MSKPTDYKRQPVCENCRHAEFIFFADYDGSEREWHCDKHICVVDNNGHCDDYKETK